MITTRSIIKQWFRRELTPLEEQFEAWIDSFYHKSDDLIPIDAVDQLDELLNGKVDRSEIENIANSIQLERRLSFGMERNTLQVFIGEAMTIYKVKGYNVNTLTINGDTVDLNQTVAIVCPADSIITITVTRTTMDVLAHVFIYAKAQIV